MYDKLSHIVCLGASAGGLQALEAVFASLPSDTGAAFVVVVHLSPDFKSLMPELLAKRTDMIVSPVTDRVRLEANNVYVIPPGKNLDLDNGTLRLTEQQRGPGHPINLGIDLFLNNLAEEVGEKAVAVILSGSGSDGSRGIREIKERGGVVFVQNPESAKFDGMPVSALQTGLADHVGPPADLAQRIVRLCSPAVPSDPLDSESSNSLIERVLAMLQVQHGSDHTYYRRAMVERRIQRRMAIAGIGDLMDYCDLLDADPAELRALRQDLLIGVTGFFRDIKAFEALETRILPAIITEAHDKNHKMLRVWVTACSTGQEAYSVAIAIQEAMNKLNIRIPIKVFATDVNEVAVARASKGVYSLSEVADVPAHLVSKYFEQRDADYAVRSQLRELIIFAKHNVVTDPPFTRMDLVSCRNLLIYLKPEVQRRVLASLHFALRPKTGVLFLGSAEIVHGLEEVTTEIDSSARLFRRSGPARMPSIRGPSRDPVQTAALTRKQPTSDLIRSALATLLAQDGRTAALVSTGGKLLELLADPNELFRLRTGLPSTNLSSLLPPDVVTAFSAAESQLPGGNDAVYSVRGLGSDEVRLRLMKLPERVGVTSPPLLLELSTRKHQDAETAISIDEAAAERISRLEQEVSSTRESLQASIEELQSTNEEQQSTNEELVAANEELQSTNEELHSVNEELFTVNAEFQRKNQDLQMMTSDLDNLLSSIDVATLFLDEQLCVRRFTPGLERVVKLMDQDIGRPITDFAHHLAHDYFKDIEQVAKTGNPVDKEVRDTMGAWMLMRARPYATLSNGQAGVILTFVEITRLKHAEESSRVMSASLREANVALAQQAGQLEDMFSIVAHDLKRPVLGLDGLLTMATEAMEDGQPEQALGRLKKAHETLGSLRRLLTDLADVSQKGRSELHVEEVDMVPWFDALLAPFQVLARERGVELNRVCDAGKTTFARAAGEAAIVNLVENALQYGTSNPSPRIDISCRFSPSMLTIVVSDNGEGIAKADHERVFELFRRLTPQASDGSGVGLVSVRRLVQRSGGSLELVSDTGTGARFQVTLPVPTPTHQSLSILLVEDDALDAKAVRMALASDRVHHVVNLALAKEALENHFFDLVLLDLSLPDGHGLSLLEVVRSGGRPLPVMLLSGLEDSLDPELLKSNREIIGLLTKERVRSNTFRRIITQLMQSART